ncbi:hypothetical protein NX059_005443 [Plenodomus lindquistii]|nr:hypothetical protein NX059_005443 [Plenodomus lindquistii]
MPIPRPLPPLLRTFQLLTSLILLSLTVFLISHSPPKTPRFPILLYTLILSSTSTTLSLLWLPPTKPQIQIPHTQTHTHIIRPITDTLFSSAWFAVFGLLLDYYDDEMQCGQGWRWDGERWVGVCGMWGAAMGFAFLGAGAWFGSAILGILGRRRGEEGVGVDGGVATGTTGRKRWFWKK